MPLWLSWLSATAGVVSLALTIWLLVVAEGAKHAAERAVGQIRRQSLREDLESMHEKIQQVGIFLGAGNRALAGLRAREVLGAGTSATSRWKDELPAQDREDLAMTVSLAKSIILAVEDVEGRVPTAEQLRSIAAAQLRAEERLSRLVGQARRASDRGQK